jgi:predicted DNA-binding protein (MmcQ/YjbR family)
MLANIKICKVDVEEIHEKKRYLKLMSALNGSSLSESFDNKTLHQCTVSKPKGNKTFSIIDFECKNNFIIISPQRISHDDNLKMARHQSYYMNKQNISKEQGQWED